MPNFANFEQVIPCFLRKTTTLLAQWLETALTAESTEWWGQYILPYLSYQQTQRIATENVTGLQQLDLAALLRVFDKNWYTLAIKHNLGNDTRNYLKELQQIRNRWAHLDGGGSSKEDAFRDLDTIIRFVKKIQPDADFLSEALSEKDKFFNRETTIPAININVDATNNKESFAVGKMVALKSNPQIKGVICQIFPQSPENRYAVFMNNQQGHYYESQLMLCKTEDSRELKSLDYIHRFITALQLQHPSTDLLYSLNAARIDFVPYQFRPVLKFIHSDRPRLLIADGVGVGKTIEAGLIMRELQARNSANSVLIICPKSLVAEHKWDNEMRRFDETFEILDGKRLRYCVNAYDLNGIWPSNYAKSIVPFSILDERFMLGQKKEIGYSKLETLPHWDLVIVDEAQHIRNAGAQAYNAVSTICDNADAVVFLTATPIQMDDQDLFNLLAILRPDMVQDQASFAHIMAPNEFINLAIQTVKVQQADWSEQTLAALTEAGNTDYGRNFYRHNSIFESVQNLLHKEMLSADERVTLLSQLEQLHTLYGLISRTRRKDIGDFTIREPHTVEVEFTADQEELYHKLLKFERDALTLMHGQFCVEFMMSTLKRQAASSIFGLEPLIDDIIKRRENTLHDIFDEYSDNINDVLSEIAAAAQEIKNGMQNISSEDRKFDALVKIIRDKERMPNKKLMVFSSFLHTLFYIHKRLRELGIRVEVVYGGVGEDDRIAIRNRFEKPAEEPDALDVLLFSEVGCEGLDYQFCDAMVNYDLPWNPQKIEQRIGRIDRRGQQSEKVMIYNLITKGTIDAVIYSRCLARIGVFERSIGECDKILGAVQNSIESIVMSNSLTDEERAKKLEQLADNQIRELKERTKLEENSCELFGIKIHESQLNNELSKADSFWLRPAALLDLVSFYLKSLGSNPETAFIGNEPLKTLRLSSEIRDKMLLDLQECKLPKNARMERWKKYLKGDEPNCKITFDNETAGKNPGCFFINPVHPLVKVAVSKLPLGSAPYTVIQVSSDDLPTGNYPFVLYSWEYSGLQNALKIVPVCSESSVQEEFFDLLEVGLFLDDMVQLAPQETFASLDEKQYQMWSVERQKYQQQTETIYQRKKSTLDASLKAKLTMCRDQIESAQNPKITAMRQGQMRNMENEYTRQQKALLIDKESSDIKATPIAYGVMVIK